MAKQYKFRKVYFICEDNKVFHSPYEMINCFRREEYCKLIAEQQRQREIADADMLWKKNEPLPKITSHGFFLVHESLFDEILKKYSKE